MNSIKNKSTILITGASGAIGGALAKIYASPTTKLIIHGRNTAALENLAKKCEDLGSKVIIANFDLRNTESIFKWIDTELLEENLPDTVFINAGVSSNNTKSLGERWEDIETVIDVNIKSAFALLNKLIPAMKKRRSGQIVVISSLAAYYGLPNTPSYCASKAALKNYGEALQAWLDPEIKVTIVMPGDIKSKMCDQMDGPVSCLMQPDKAAKIIKKGVTKRKRKIIFPFPVNFGAWLLTIIPSTWAIFFLKILGYKLK